MTIDVPTKLLTNPITDKRLIDVLNELADLEDDIRIVTDNPGVTDKPIIVYNRTNKKLIICDTDEVRQIATEEI